jgi:hypothetical protein
MCVCLCVCVCVCVCVWAWGVWADAKVAWTCKREICKRDEVNHQRVTPFTCCPTLYVYVFFLTPPITLARRYNIWREHITLPMASGPSILLIDRYPNRVSAAQLVWARTSSFPIVRRSAEVVLSFHARHVMNFTPLFMRWGK